MIEHYDILELPSAPIFQCIYVGTYLILVLSPQNYLFLVVPMFQVGKQIVL